MSGLLLLMTGRALLVNPKGRNASRDDLAKIGWVVYLSMFPCILSFNKLLMAFSLVCCVTIWMQDFTFSIFVTHMMEPLINICVLCGKHKKIYLRMLLVQGLKNYEENM